MLEVLQVATHELAWVLNEEYRLVVQRSPRRSEFEAIVKSALEHRQAALYGYFRHVEEHGCLTQTAKAD